MSSALTLSCSSAGFVNDTLFANSNPILNYTSPLLHHVQINNLLPNTTYFYQVPPVFSASNPVIALVNYIWYFSGRRKLQATFSLTQVSAGGGVNSSVFNFSTPPAVGAYPLKMGVFADVGQTSNSSETLKRLLDGGTSVLAFIGDWT